MLYQLGLKYKKEVPTAGSNSAIFVLNNVHPFSKHCQLIIGKMKVDYVTLILMQYQFLGLSAVQCAVYSLICN